MADIETSTVSEEGYACTSQVGEFDLQIDATDETGPNPNAALVATYASCYLPAFRVGGSQRGEEELGKVQIDASAVLDDDDDSSPSPSTSTSRPTSTTRPRPTSPSAPRASVTSTARCATTSTPTSASTRARSEAATRHFNRFFRDGVLRPATRSAGPPSARGHGRSTPVNSKRAPPSAPAVSVTSQPWASAMRSTMASPNPVPDSEVV